MSWNYSFNPESSAKDEVRFLVGDTNSKQPLLQDEEITYLLNKYNNYPLNASVRACEMIIAKFSRMADETVGSVSKSFSQMATAYFKTMEMLRTRIGLEGARPYAGGISKSDKQINRQNEDLVEPDFKKHQFENEQLAPWTSETEHEEYLDNEQ
jgi:hypothetical protein